MHVTEGRGKMKGKGVKPKKNSRRNFPLEATVPPSFIHI